jgi:membrane protease YdiL (CAAX protease family)
MNGIRSFVERRSLVVYFILAYAFSWALSALLSVSLVFGLLALFGPALAALIVSALAEGGPGVRRLLGKLALWRVSLLWYLIAFGLPFLISAAARLLDVWFFHSGSFQANPISGIQLVLFVLVVGEELGWRGYALPRLLENRSALSASLILGVLWVGWHVPTFILPGMPNVGNSIFAYSLWVISLTVLFTWISQHTRGSVLLATLFHGAANLSGALIGNIAEIDRWWWLSGLVYLAAALLVVLLAGKQLRRPAGVQVETARA